MRIPRVSVPQVNAKGAQGLLLAWGKFRFMFGYATFYISLISMVLLMVTAYNTTARDWSMQYLHYELPFWQFATAILLLAALGFLLEYVVSIPCMVAVSNEQMYKHDSPIKTDFNDVRRRQDELDAKLEKIMEHLGVK